MKKNLALFLISILITTSFFSGCTNNNNNNNSPNSKIVLTLLDYKDGNLTTDEFINISASDPPDGYKFFYVRIKLRNLFDKNILINPYYLTIIDENGMSFMHHQKTFKLTMNFSKSYVGPGDTYQGRLIFMMFDYSVPIKLRYFDPINNVNISIPIKV